MPTASGRSAVVAFGRQTAEGVPLAVPTFETFMAGGMVGPERSTQELDWTTESQDSVGFYVERTAGTLDLSIPVLPGSAGAILQAVLGTRTTSPGPAPFSHVFTPNDVLPFMSFWYAQPGQNYWKLQDAKVGSWGLSFSPGSPLQASLSGFGRTTTRSPTKWGTAGTVEAAEPFFTMIGAEILLDAAASPAVTRVRNVGAGSLTVNRNVEGIQTDDVGYQYMPEQKREVELALDDVVFEDNDFINSIFTGSDSGTDVSSQVVYGSFGATFIGSDEAAASVRSLTVELPRVLFAMDRVPEADPSGAAVRYTVTGRVSKPAAGASVTATLVNDLDGTDY